MRHVFLFCFQQATLFPASSTDAPPLPLPLPPHPTFTHMTHVVNSGDQLQGFLTSGRPGCLGACKTGK
jgi:hypothetical protein